jgi:hypothetical protein
MSIVTVSRNTFLCALAFLALPFLASARPKTENTQMEKKSMDLRSAATVDGKALQPGNYEVVIEGNQVRFEREGKTVVTAPCNWKGLGYKSPYDSVTFSASRQLQELDFAGSDQALEVM